MKERKSIMSPVFQTKEQEKLFAKCAKDSMNMNTRLISEDEGRGKVIMSPVFQTKEQEELFAKCAEEAMFNHINSKLQSEGKKKILKNIKGVEWDE